MFEKYMIVEDKLKNVVDESKVSGFQFGARLPYYRGVSLSMLEEIEVSVDGTVLPQDKVHLIVRDNTYDLKQREEELDDRWEMGEVVKLFIENEGGLSKGKHQLGLKINIRIGYLPFPAIRNAQKEITID